MEDVDHVQDEFVDAIEILNPIKPEDLIFFISFIIGFLSDILIIYCILRFKKMQTKVNLCVLNWSIASCFTLLTQIRSYKLIAHAFGFIIYSNFLCYTLQYQTIFHTASAIFMMLLSIDYVFDKLTFKKLIISFSVIWSITTIVVIISTILCANNLYIAYPAVFLKISLFLFLIIMILKCCSYKKTSNITERIKICLSSCFLIYWLTFWILMTINIIFYTNVLKNIYVFIFLLVYLYPLISLILLTYIDINFKLCLLQTIRCSYQYVEATISYKDETNNNELRNGDNRDINDENSSIDIVISSNNANM